MHGTIPTKPGTSSFDEEVVFFGLAPQEFSPLPCEQDVEEESSVTLAVAARLSGPACDLLPQLSTFFAGLLLGCCTRTTQDECDNAAAFLRGPKVGSEFVPHATGLWTSKILALRRYEVPSLFLWFVPTRLCAQQEGLAFWGKGDVIWPKICPALPSNWKMQDGVESAPSAAGSFCNTTRARWIMDRQGSIFCCGCVCRKFHNANFGGIRSLVQWLLDLINGVFFFAFMALRSYLPLPLSALGRGGAGLRRGAGGEGSLSDS
ncbi:hypothetical protein QBC34DRAFT_181388 [Podospora aff. communis PSN243]|uniref:Uncharacterized protein n=1 Tax=Podospora aff. communis PSN243 TaxID=3040156 RepID=A0AAV9G9Z3_9PEZI|nr:hypothetical protein QBC34DRAFT_181388 [Podospora aff. communis PSN243]